VFDLGVRWRVGEAPATGRPAAAGRKESTEVSPFNRMFGGRSPAPVHVRYQDGEPVEFQRRPLRRGSRYLITDVRERWIEESPWPFPSPMPVGGDRLRCWRVVAHPADEPYAPAHEFVLRMRAGPGVWDLVRVAE
jgi:hypothetical protein